MGVLPSYWLLEMLSTLCSEAVEFTQWIFRQQFSNIYLVTTPVLYAEAPVGSLSGYLCKKICLNINILSQLQFSVLGQMTEVPVHPLLSPLCQAAWFPHLPFLTNAFLVNLAFGFHHSPACYPYQPRWLSLLHRSHYPHST